MSKTSKITVAISSGDTNGIGLEVALKAFSDPRMLDACTPVIYASKDVCLFHANHCDISLDNINYTNRIENLKHGKINILETWKEKVWVEFGKESKEAGQAAFISLQAAVEDLASNKTDVLVTAPINKASIQSSEFNFPGHTEYLASYANEDNPLMILANESLRVALVCGHLPLKDVASHISIQKIVEKIEVFSKSLRVDFGLTRPKIAVLGLNPHNGDNGLLGSEEMEIISPAIAQAQDSGYLAFGPYAADGLFGSQTLYKFDGILAMYHDQGLAPFKALSFGSGVNFTAGLPIVRTSPDHGTAFDIAGKGFSNPGSFIQSVNLACDIFKERIEQRELKQNALETTTK